MKKETDAEKKTENKKLFIALSPVFCKTSHVKLLKVDIIQ